MPAWIAFGVKSRTSDAFWVREALGLEPEVELEPHAANAKTAMPAMRIVVHRRIRRGRIGVGPKDRARFVESGERMRRRVTFSRNLTLSLSRTCRCYCKYCAFATHQPHLHAPDEVRADPRQAVSAPPRQGAPGADGRAPGGQRRRRRAARGVRVRRLHGLRRVGVRAGARARAAAAHEPRGAGRAPTSSGCAR